MFPKQLQGFQQTQVNYNMFDAFIFLFNIIRKNIKVVIDINMESILNSFIGSLKQSTL